MRHCLKWGLAGGLALSSLMVSAGTPPPISAVTTEGQTVAADGWMRLEGPEAPQFIRGQLSLCAGEWVQEARAPAPAICHRLGNHYTTPTFWRFGERIPGPRQVEMTPQQYLDAHTAQASPAHRLQYTGYSVDRAGRVWLFYKIQAPL